MIEIPYLDRQLNGYEFSVEDDDDDHSILAIDLGKLDLLQKIRGKRMRFIVECSLDLPTDGLANLDDVAPNPMVQNYLIKFGKN